MIPADPVIFIIKYKRFVGAKISKVTNAKAMIMAMVPYQPIDSEMI
jgi:hypothetical protein